MNRVVNLQFVVDSGVLSGPDKIGILTSITYTRGSAVKFREFFASLKSPYLDKMADCGVMDSSTDPINHRELFLEYEKLNVNYGVMLDVLRNKEKTIASAKDAIRVYSEKDYSFNLVAVAQGETVTDYMECYESLRSIGFKHIAIGGMVRKLSGTTLRRVNDDILRKIVRTIRTRYENDWLFLLGCYHPKRVGFMKDMAVYGADSNGWLFRYKKHEGGLIDEPNQDADFQRRVRSNQLSQYIKGKVLRSEQL